MSANESKSWFVEHLKTGGVFLLRGVEHSIRDSGRDAPGRGGGERFAEGAAELAVLPAHAWAAAWGLGPGPRGGRSVHGEGSSSPFPRAPPRRRSWPDGWETTRTSLAVECGRSDRRPLRPTFLFLGVLAALSPRRLEEGPAPLPSPGELKVWGGRTLFGRTCTRKHSHPPAA